MQFVWYLLKQTFIAIQPIVSHNTFLSKWMDKEDKYLSRKHSTPHLSLYSISMYTINTALIIQLANNGLHAWDMLWDEKTFFFLRIEANDINIAQRYLIIWLESRYILCIILVTITKKSYTRKTQFNKIEIIYGEVWVISSV